MDLVDTTEETGPTAAAWLIQASDCPVEPKPAGILLRSLPAEQPTNPDNNDADDVNPTLTWIAISPIGTPLADYANTMELLYAFRNAIRAHKSLYF